MSSDLDERKVNGTPWAELKFMVDEPNFVESAFYLELNDEQRDQL